MRHYRGFLALLLGLALSAGLSCSAGEEPLGIQGGGDSTAAEQPVPPGDSASVPPADSGGVPAETSLLMCQQQEYAVTTAVIGPMGGQISVGNHSLRILENALSEDVTITAEQIAGQVNSVRFSPEGLQFAMPTMLTLSYENCDSIPYSKRIVYTDDSLQILQSLPSVDVDSLSQVNALIYHFSRYAVAY